MVRISAPPSELIGVMPARRASPFLWTVRRRIARYRNRTWFRLTLRCRAENDGVRVVLSGPA